MNKLLYIVSGIIVIIWIVAYVGFQAGPFIHILLVIADIPIILTMLRKEETDIMIHEF